jgi:hypothetical protein
MSADMEEMARKLGYTDLEEFLTHENAQEELDAEEEFLDECLDDWDYEDEIDEFPVAVVDTRTDCPWGDACKFYKAGCCRKKHVTTAVAVSDTRINCPWGDKCKFYKAGCCRNKH